MAWGVGTSSSSRTGRSSSSSPAASYDYLEYLGQVPEYERKSDDLLQGRATTAADIIFDPQRAEEKRQAQWNEAQHVNNLAKLKAANAGTDEALALNNAQLRKSSAVRAAGSGAIGSSGLSDYLKNQADISTQAQRLSIAATQAANNAAEINNFDTLDKQSQNKLAEIEQFRGKTGQSLLDQYQDAEDNRENAWNMNRLNVALGIGEGELNAADINQRAANEAARIAQMKYDTDMGYKIAKLPYDNMTQYDQARVYLDSSSIFGEAPGGGSSRSYGSNSNASGPYGTDTVGGGTNQYRYLQGLLSQGGGNAEWAKDQLARGLY